MTTVTRKLIVALLLAGLGQSYAAALPPPDAAAPDAALTPSQARASTIPHEALLMRLPQGEAEVHRFVVPLARVALSYVDLSYETPLVAALGAHDLVVNGGYWGYRGEARVIEGLLIVDDQQIAPAHRHGGVLEVRSGEARVVRGEAFKPAPGTALALQCSPRLVDAGKLVPKLEARKRAARTAVCVGEDRTQLGLYLTEDRVTLPELAAFLRAQGCVEALNLDGGPSTAAVARTPNGPITIGHGGSLPYGIGFRLGSVR